MQHYTSVFTDRHTYILRRYIFILCNKNIKSTYSFSCHTISNILIKRTDSFSLILASKGGKINLLHFFRFGMNLINDSNTISVRFIMLLGHKQRPSKASVVIHPPEKPLIGCGVIKASHYYYQQIVPNSGFRLVSWGEQNHLIG